ncbi:MAG: photosynthetic complex assembly protein PuhC [Oxalobacteraceae bacterium]
MKLADPLHWAVRARREFNPAVGFAIFAVACLLLVGWVRFTSPAPTPNVITPTAMRVLNFIDQPDGSISVIDQETHDIVENFSGEQGFLRGTLRALVRERKLRGLDADQAHAFELIAHDGGRLTLRDPATDASIALESFGPTNTAVFARLLR